jgi:hypothetical protein
MIDNNNDKTNMTYIKTDTVSKINIKCRKCNKTCNLNNFKCRCDQIYCIRHKLPELHDCNYDYIENGKIEIIKNNPKIKSEKLDKIDNY